jgi:hypothetical protein
MVDERLLGHARHAAQSVKREHGQVVDGCRIRELPDGGREFVLDQPVLSYIRIDHQARLQFGRAEVAIGSPFVLAMAGAVHRLDPQQRSTLGPLLALFPGSLRWLWASAGGELTALFDNGAKVAVATDPVGKAWSVGAGDDGPGGTA